MASKRDLVEAHAFNRRRLVTAFLSGAPGGREVEPVRYGRTVVGGVVLAALLVAGAAVVGVLRPAVGSEWRENGLVIAKESGSRFVVTNEQLFPVINTASARLILATEGDLRVTFVPDSVLVDEPKFQTVGINGAPDYLPPPSQLLQTGWTSCTNEEGGLRSTVSTEPTVRAVPDTALVAIDSETREPFLVSGSMRYPIRGNAAGVAILQALGLDRQEPFRATTAWLELLPLGTEIKPFEVEGSGAGIDTPVSGLDRVGTPVDVDGAGYVLGRAGLVPLSDFAYEVYLAGASQAEQSLSVGELQGLATDRDTVVSPDDWPTSLVQPFEGSDPCLLLERGETATDTSTPRLAEPRDPENAATSDDKVVEVEQGHGSLVLSTTRTTGDLGDTAFLIDSRGTRFALGPKQTVRGTMTRLGYKDVAPVPTPRAWVELFASGPELSPSAAIEPAAP